MTPAERVQLTLVVDPASDPITGALGDGHGKDVEFSGWLDFAVALQQVLGASPASAAAQPAGELNSEQP